MCASYGLDPRMGDYSDALDEQSLGLIDGIRKWSEQNAGTTLRPTGKNARNLNPIVRQIGSDRLLELAWWGYLVDGEPAKFPSINARSERLRDRPGGANRRVLVPATQWFELQKPSRDWYSFGTGKAFMMAAVAQRGIPSGGAEVTCYSIVMRPAAAGLEHIHDRMPVLLPTSFHGDWLDPTTKGSRELLEAALDASDTMTDRVSASRVTARP